MTSAVMHQARVAPVSDNELLGAKNDFVEAEAAKLLKTDLLGLFAELDADGAEILHRLHSGSLLDLLELQQRFRDRMKHEARAVAARSWTASEAARAAMAIQDGRCE